MIDFVKGLEGKGYTYRIEDGIYFDVRAVVRNELGMAVVICEFCGNYDFGTEDE